MFVRAPVAIDMLQPLRVRIILMAELELGCHETGERKSPLTVLEADLQAVIDRASPDAASAVAIVGMKRLVTGITGPLQEPAP